MYNIKNELNTNMMRTEMPSLMTSLPDQAIDQLRERATDACKVLKIMSNPDRLLLLCQMMDVARNVSELESLTGIHQPTLSQQLAILRAEDFVETRREGKNIYYMLANPQVSALMHAMYEIFCGPGIVKK